MKPIKLGVLGVSRHYGLRIQTPAVNSPCIELTAIGSRSMARATDAAKHWGFKNAYGSYQAVINDSEVEAVYIPLPNDVHAEWIKKCADAGKAVLCEKPIALNANEALNALEYAAKKNVPVMEAFMYRFHPQWLRAKEIIDAGEIGDIMAIHTIFSFFNNDMANIRNRKENGGGALYDIGCYAISSARFLLNREPKRVMGNITFDPQAQVDTLTSAMMDFGKPRAQFTVSTRMMAQQIMSVYGSGGTLILKRPFNAYPDVAMSIIVNDGDGPRELQCGPADQYGLMLEAFAQAVHSGQAMPWSESVANMQVIDAIFASQQSGNWENV